MIIENRVTINAPADKVFEYVADVLRHPEWAGRPLQMKRTSDGPTGVGSTFESTGKQFGTHTDAVRVTEYAPPSRFAIESTGDAGVMRHVFAMTESGGTTTLTKTFEMVKGSLSARIFKPVIKMVAPKDAQANLERIKQRVEGSA
ncbi:MAG: SRPBCC family protein [Actinomycetota bacterium]